MKEKNITFIAEIGLNHNGNFGLLYELIRQASRAGADYAKFQLGWRSGKGEINRLGSDEIELIHRSCQLHDIKPLFSIFTEEALELSLKHGFACYKVASRTVKENPRLVEEILKQNKLTFISLGMTGELQPFGMLDHVQYLWCKSEYPAYPWNLTDLPKTFPERNIVGYSDHSVGIDVPLIAIARGAITIEKHLTLDKSDITIRDHALSATPDEFQNLVELGRGIRKNLELGV